MFREAVRCAVAGRFVLGLGIAMIIVCACVLFGGKSCPSVTKPTLRCLNKLSPELVRPIARILFFHLSEDGISRTMGEGCYKRAHGECACDWMYFDCGLVISFDEDGKVTNVECSEPMP